MRNPKFNSKEEYLAYRSEWKAEYKQLSKDIRDIKFARNFPVARRFDIGANVRRYWEIEKRLLDNPNTSAEWKLIDLRTKAYWMLEELKSAKIRAQEQYLAAKAKKETVTA